MNTLNQTPEQLARDNIDKLLAEAGWSGCLNMLNFSFCYSLPGSLLRIPALATFVHPCTADVVRHAAA